MALISIIFFPEQLVKAKAVPSTCALCNSGMKGKTAIKDFFSVSNHALREAFSFLLLFGLFSIYFLAVDSSPLSPFAVVAE